MQNSDVQQAPFWLWDVLGKPQVGSAASTFCVQFLLGLVAKPSTIGPGGAAAFSHVIVSSGWSQTKNKKCLSFSVQLILNV